MVGMNAAAVRRHSRCTSCPLCPYPSAWIRHPLPADYCNPANVEESWRDRAEFVRIAAQKLEARQPGEGERTG